MQLIKNNLIFESILTVFAHLLAAIAVGFALMPCGYFIMNVFFIIKSLDMSIGAMIPVICISFGIAYFIFGYGLLFFIVIVRIIFRVNSTESNIQISFTNLIPFAAHSGFLLIAGHFFLPLIRSTFLINWFYRGMGAKIGKGTIINTLFISDCNLIEIGNNCKIGGNVFINGHSAEGEILLRKKVIINNNVTIGQSTTILPGVVIGNNVIIGANSLLIKNQVLLADKVYGGIPAQILKENIQIDKTVTSEKLLHKDSDINPYIKQIENIKKHLKHPDALLTPPGIIIEL